MEYLSSADAAPAGCIFCDFPAAGPSGFRGHLILCATPEAFVIMNRYPYSNGHLMVVPRRHENDPAKLPADELAALSTLLVRSTTIVREVMGAHGLNLGMNLGRVAGAGIDQHLHWHIVPRWNGDTNFMPVLADVKVMSEHLTATYERFLPAFAGLGEGPGEARTALPGEGR